MRMSRRHITQATGILCAAAAAMFLLAAMGVFGWWPSRPAPKAYALGPTPDALISQGVPVYTNGYNYSGGTQSALNDDNYGTQLCSPTQPVTPSSPFYAAYDLSGVPTSERGQVLWAMFANTYPFDLSYFNDVAYNVPADWTIDANAAGGGAYPSSGWVTLTTVTNNTWGTRQGTVNLTGYNWLRINVTGNLGSSGNDGACINSLDIHNVSSGMTDDWMFFGDSITANTMDPGTDPTVAQLINQADSSYFPLMEPGGIPFLMTADGAAHIATWLQSFPGRYVGLSYGTNDAGGNVSAQTFYNNYVTMVQAVLTAGKIPVVPTVIWRCSPYDTTIQQYNQEIQTLYTNYPQIVHGPDLYAYFSANQSYISSNDCIHPNSAGDIQYRQLWANALLANVYQSPVDNPPSVPAGLRVTALASTSATLTWDASTDSDSSGVAGYKLYRDGSVAATIVGAANLTYTDTGLHAGTAYDYTISAYDTAANESSQSAAVHTTTDAAAVAGDCNGDSHVTIFDLSILLSHYGQTYAACDFNSDSVVNILDLSILLSNYGT